MPTSTADLMDDAGNTANRLCPVSSSRLTLRQSRGIVCQTMTQRPRGAVLGFTGKCHGAWRSLTPPTLLRLGGQRRRKWFSDNCFRTVEFMASCIPVSQPCEAATLHHLGSSRPWASAFSRRHVEPPFWMLLLVDRAVAITHEPRFAWFTGGAVSLSQVFGSCVALHEEALVELLAALQAQSGLRRLQQEHTNCSQSTLSIFNRRT